MLRLSVHKLTICLILFFNLSLAQDLSQKAINLAVTHPAFASMLAANEGWQAESFNTQNIYGIWRVQFWDAQGNKLARADLNPEKDQIYDWIYQRELNEQEQENVSQTLLSFINNQSAVTDLVGNVDSKDLRISYHNSNRNWRVRINRQQNSLHLVITPLNPTTRSLEGLELSNVLFDNIPSYEDWRSGNEANLVAIAFQEAAIAAALRGKENWTTEVQPLEAQNWQVSFLEGGTVLALAEIDPFESVVLRFELSP